MSLSYCVPREFRDALALKGANLGDSGRIAKAAIRALNHDHPGSVPPSVTGGLAKRLHTAMANEYRALLADRAILTWLCERREEWADLAKIRGGGRDVFAREMYRRGDIPKF